MSDDFFVITIPTGKYKPSYSIVDIRYRLPEVVVKDGYVLKTVKVLGSSHLYKNLKVSVLNPTTLKVSYDGYVDDGLELEVVVTSKDNILSSVEGAKVSVSDSISFYAHDLVDMIESGTLLLNVPYQRGHVWTDTQKAEFILSWLRGEVILTPYLVGYYKDGLELVYDVLDGKQRISALYSFIKNEFSINGLYYKDLLSYDKYYLEHSRVFAIVLSTKNKLKGLGSDDLSELAKTFINLNTKGTRLTEEELDYAKRLIKE